ncbi:hypothetical protein AMIS_43760 [Actinoplanes missouriensis 431]|uniref:Uncharacterized protein n=1 Tax=Actinoplanes missouriensis (strain ATCC 14538 / DSM 43046 / CBS 188.64 / JCM 3121 / NBRC 102363 / NCIMB 12654 / NRRL B-3342 / UNCC 431) TaxID=512565 RepID=I0H9A9_ACTM4|nr:hypothetical protein [Actinoplanes missouriensis]BAL89596.1 hypothetical protein AMIS_43760 [Actinoplanes missouriensis 431]
MTHEEKRAWVRLVVAVLGYGAYLAVVLSRAGGRPLTEIPYATVLLISVGAAIVAGVVGETALAAMTPHASRATDERDREIGRLGEHVGQAFLVLGALAAMLMAMADWDQFWIANVIYLGFVLSAVVGGVAKVVVYRTGVPQW